MGNLEEVTDNPSFYTVEYCIQNYINMATFYQDNELTEQFEKGESNYYDELLTDDQKKEILMQLLDKKYITENNITVNTMTQKITSYKENSIFQATEAKRIREKNLEQYVIKGKTYIGESKKTAKQEYFMVNLDSGNGTYSILPITEEAYKNYSTSENQYNKDKIEENENNAYSYIRLSKQEILKNYINYFTKEMETNIQEAYQLLEEDYRNYKFNNISSFRTLITSREMEKIEIKEYGQKEYDKYTQYMIQDSNGNYYIFNETSPMQFTMLLDTYTIDIPQFTEKYKTSSTQNKVALNIEKIRLALNDKDYKYVYSKLADSFKQNYFKTQQEFENYAKNTFFSKNTIEYTNIEKQGNNYVCSVEIKNEEDKGAKAIEKTIIVQLLEETNFVMSFNYEE